MTRNRRRILGGKLWYEASNIALNGVLPSLVHQYDVNRYYNSASGPTAFPFTAVRTTNATLFDSNGNLVWAPANMLAHSQPVLNATWTLTGAGTFSTGGQDDPFGGTTAVNLVAGNGISTILNDSAAAARLVGNLTVMSGATYAMVFYAKANVLSAIRVREPVATGARAHINLITGAITGETGTVNNAVTGIMVEASDQSNGWWKITVTRRASSTSFNMDIKPGQDIGDGVSGVFISSVMVHPYDGIEKSFVATTGTAYYGPRFDYDPVTFAPRGLLIEESRTNFQSLASSSTPSDWNSANFVSPTSGGSQWNFPVITLTTTSTVSPAFAYTVTSALSAISGNNYAVSGFFKRGSNRFVQLTTSSNYNPGSWLNYDFDTNTFTENGFGTIAGSGNAQVLTNGWVRLSISFTANSTNSGAAIIVGFPNSLADARLPVCSTSNASVLTFGHQAETGIVATSHIPTYGASATRSTESFEAATASWLTQGLGTMLIKYIAPKHPAGIFPTLSILDDNTGNNRIMCFFQSNTGNTNFGARIDESAAIQLNTSTPGTVNYYTTASGAMAYSLNNTRLVQNGSTITLDAACVIPTSVNTFRVGKSGAATASTRWIKEIRYYPSISASDAQLQALTT